MTALDDLIRWYESMTPESLAHIGKHYAEDAVFRDPFNDVQGTQAIAAIFHHMFTTVEQPRFVVKARFTQGDEAMLLWVFHFALKGKPMQIEGSSHLRFNAAGMVVLHRDYWDSSAELLQKLPLLGGVFRWVARGFTAQ